MTTPETFVCRACGEEELWFNSVRAGVAGYCYGCMEERDMFARGALPALVNPGIAYGYEPNEHEFEATAILAYAYADAMMQARRGGP